MEVVTPLPQPYPVPLFILIHSPDGTTTNYVIQSYTPQQLTAANTADISNTITLTNINGRWTVPGDTTNAYQVEIVPDTILTGVEAADIKILQYLDLPTLEFICQHIPYVHSICQQDRLWEAKLLSLYPDFPPTPDYLSRDVYRRLARDGIRGLWNWAIRRHVNNVLEWIARRYVADPIAGFEGFYPPGTKRVWTFNYNDAERQAEDEPQPVDSPDMLAWFLASDAIQAGYVNVVDIINVSPDAYGIGDGPYSLDDATANGHLDVLKLVASKFGKYPSEAAVQLATENNHLDVLKWLNDNGLPPDNTTAHTAAKYGYTEILQWLRQIGLPLSSNVADTAAELGKIETFRWLLSVGVLPSQSGVIWAISRQGHLDILQELDQAGVLQNVIGSELNELIAETLLVERAGNTARWLMNKFGVQLNPEIIDFLLSQDTFIAGPYAQSTLKLTTEEANDAAGKELLHVLEWLYEKGVKPDERGVAYAVQNGRHDSVRWLLGYNIPVPKDISLSPAFLPLVRWAALRNYVDILNWLAGGGRYYDKSIVGPAGVPMLTVMKSSAPVQKGTWYNTTNWEDYSHDSPIFVNVFAYVPYDIELTNNVVIIDVDLVMGNNMEVLKRAVPGLIGKNYTVVLVSSFHPVDEEEKRDYYRNVATFANNLDIPVVFVVSTEKDQAGVLGEKVWEQIVELIPGLDVGGSFFSGDKSSDEDFATGKGVELIPPENLFN